MHSLMCVKSYALNQTKTVQAKFQRSEVLLLILVELMDRRERGERGGEGKYECGKLVTESKGRIHGC